MTQALIVLLSIALGGVLVWALGLRQKAQSLPGEREAIERRRAELREEEAAAAKEAEAEAAAERERIEGERDEDSVDWANRRYGLGDHSDGGDG